MVSNKIVELRGHQRFTSGEGRCNDTSPLTPAQVRKTFLRCCGFLIVILFIGGCASFSARISPDEVARAHSLLIVPIEAPPALVAGFERPYPLIGGIGTEIVTRDARRKLAEQLNEMMRYWRAEQVLAEECVGLLQARSVQPFTELRVAPPVALPGAPTPSKEEPGPFSANVDRWKSGADAAMRWRNTEPLRDYKAEPRSGNTNWVLEVGQVSLMLLGDGSLLIETQARLIDTITGRTLAKGSAVGKAQLEQVDGNQSVVHRWQRQYRTGVRKLCVRMLADMGMIVREGNKEDGSL